jgi:hypothetical protein
VIQRLFRDWTKPMGFSLRSSETWPETSRNFMEDFPASHVWFQHLYECFGWPPTHLDNTVLYVSNYLFIDLVWYDLIYWLIDWLFWPLYWIYNFLYFGIVAGSPNRDPSFLALTGAHERSGHGPNWTKARKVAESARNREPLSHLMPCVRKAYLDPLSPKLPETRCSI